MVDALSLPSQTSVNYDIPTTNIVLEQWYSICYTLLDSKIKMFVDGQLIGTGQEVTGPFDGNSLPLYFGGSTLNVVELVTLQ